MEIRLSILRMVLLCVASFLMGAQVVLLHQNIDAGVSLWGRVLGIFSGACVVVGIIWGALYDQKKRSIA